MFNHKKYSKIKKYYPKNIKKQKKYKFLWKNNIRKLYKQYSDDLYFVKKVQCSRMIANENIEYLKIYAHLGLDGTFQKKL